MGPNVPGDVRNEALQRAGDQLTQVDEAFIRMWDDPDSWQTIFSELPLLMSIYQTHHSIFSVWHSRLNAHANEQLKQQAPQQGHQQVLQQQQQYTPEQRSFVENIEQLRGQMNQMQGQATNGENEKNQLLMQLQQG